MLIVRVCLVVIGVSNLLGVIWFLDSLDGFSILSGVSSSVVALIISIFYNDNLEKYSLSAKYTLILLSLMGIFGQLYPVYGYIVTLKTMQIFPIVLSGLLCIAYASVIFEISQNLGRNNQ